MMEVRRLRQARGWNQTELAYHSGLAPSVISQIENGKRDPSAGTLKKLAKALEVDVPDLFPKGQAPLPFEGAAHPELDWLSGYLLFLKQQTEGMSARWEEAMEENTFGLGAWDEAVEVAVGLGQNFVETVPIEVYASGNRWLPREKWEAVAETLGGLSNLRTTLDKAYHAYEVRFEEKGAPAGVEDLAAVREQRMRLMAAPETPKTEGTG